MAQPYPGNRFSDVKISGWRQFEEIDVDLRSNLTVLTGPNGCGKTTVLNILARHFGWNLNFVATPYLSGRQQQRMIWTDIAKTIQSIESDTTPPPSAPDS